MAFDQEGLVLSTFITSSSFYCPIVWVFHSTRLMKGLIISTKGLYESLHKKMMFSVNPIQHGLFRGCSWMGGGKKAPLPKICRTYSTMMNETWHSHTLPKEDPKNI